MDYPDQHYLRAAHGWLELGRPQEALEELEHISPALYFNPEVLELRWKMAVEAADWSGALELARNLVLVAPERASGWISRSFCLHELKQTEAAWKCLFPAARKFPTVSIIPYNLACYACQLGRLTQARNWLKKAMVAGAKTQIKAMALSDDDLKPLWPVIGKY